MVAGVADGRPIVVWEGLPESYQSDINELVQSFGKNMDADVWNQTNSLLTSVHEILATKQQFVLNYPAVKNSASPESTRATIKQGTKTLKTLLDATQDLEKLKTFDGATFLDSTGKEIALQMIDLVAMAEQTSSDNLNFDLNVEVLESTDTSAKLRMVTPEGKTLEDVDYILHDGKWLPKNMVDDWDKNMQQAKAAVAQLPEQIAPVKGQVTMGMMAASGLLAPLKAAENQEQFDKAVDGIMAGAQSMIGGMMGGMGGPPAGGQGSGSQGLGGQ